MTTNPKHFRISDRNLSWIGRYRPDMTESGQVREDLAVLDYLIKAGSKEVADLNLTPSEASFILDAFLGLDFNSSKLNASFLAYPLSNLIEELAGFSKINGIDDKGIIERLDTLSTLGGLALVHMIRVFRANNQGGHCLSIGEVFPLGQ